MSRPGDATVLYAKRLQVTRDNVDFLQRMLTRQAELNQEHSGRIESVTKR